MAKNGALELSIHIAGKVDGSFNSALSITQNRISDLSRTLSKIGTVGLAAMGAVGTAGVKFVADCVKEAEDFEDQMANVVKYVDGLADELGQISPDKIFEGNGKTYAENYAMVKDAINDLSTQIPYTQEELTKLAAAAGQSGKSITDLLYYDAKGNIQGFLRDAAMLGTAWDIDAELAGDYAAKWEKSFNMTHEEVMTLADQINYLGANSATTAAELANTVNKAGSIGQIAGADVSVTAALADAMLATGVNTDRAGTALKNMFQRMTYGESATDKMKGWWQELGFTAVGVAKSMQKDAVGTTLSVFKAINALPDYERLAAIKELFGNWSLEGAAKIANNMSTYIDALNMVKDPSLYEGSMLREFDIKSGTTKAQEQMLENSIRAFKESIGTEFLPVKKQFLEMFTDVFNELRKHSPEITQLAGTLADLASNGVSKLGDALDAALPAIQKGLDYVANNGEQVVKVIGGLAAAFGAMKFAPMAEMLLNGAGSLLMGGNALGGAAGKTGSGLLGTIGGLFASGVNAKNTITAGADVLGRGAGLGIFNQASGKGGLLGNLGSGLMGMIGAGSNMSALLDPKKSAKAFASLDSSLYASGLNGGGLFGMLGNMLKGSKAGQAVGSYAGAVGGKLGGLAQNPIVSGLGNIIGGVGKGIGGVLSPVGSFIGSGFKGLGQGYVDLAKYIGGGIANSKAGQFIGGAAKGVGSVAGTAIQGIGGAIGMGTDLLGGVFGTLTTAAAPITGIFSSIISGALPIVGVISSIIAVVSILGDNLDGIRNIIQNVFGQQGVMIFDTFIEKIQGIGDFINSLFGDGLINLMAPLKETITGMFGKDAGAAFDGFVGILQSVMNIIQELVNFSITYVKPVIQEIIDFIVNTALPLVLQTFAECAPTISTILTTIGEMIKNVAVVIMNVINTVKPYVAAIVEGILRFASGALPQLLEAVSNVATNIKNYIDDVVQVFSGLIDFIVGVFTGNWDLAWQGVVEVFSGVFGAIVDLGKAILNSVIGIINGVIGGINSLGSMLPEKWGGGFQIPEIPYLAKGGFTNGPSIAGEAGTEAVISFQRGVRNQNIATWMQAGKMLGMDALARPQEVELADVGEAYSYTGGAVTFSPQITITGNADDGVMDRAIARMKSEFETWYKQMVRREQRTRY